MVGANDLILNVVVKTRLELNEIHKDKWPLLEFRRTVNRIRIHINLIAHKIIYNKIFENICIGVILANSITLAMEDP